MSYMAGLGGFQVLMLAFKLYELHVICLLITANARLTIVKDFVSQTCLLSSSNYGNSRSVHVVFMLSRNICYRSSNYR